VEGSTGEGPRTAWLVAHPWLATAAIALIATTFALGSTMVRFAYDAGAGTLTIVVTRMTVAVVGLAVANAALGVKLRLDRRERWAAPFIGLFMAGYSAAFYMGFEYMPVGLTVLTFYTYPLMTGLVAWATGQERFGLAGVIALPMAFVGLLVALDVSGSRFSLIGAGWALLGGAGFAAVLVLSAWLLPKRSDTRPRTLAMLATAWAAALAASLLARDIWFPTTALGWFGLMTSALCYSVAMTAILYVASVMGATRVAVVMNAEPIASLVLTFLVLGERLHPMQLVGAAIVIAAIFLFRPRRGGMAPRPVESAASG